MYWIRVTWGIWIYHPSAFIMNEHTSTCQRMIVTVQVALRFHTHTHKLFPALIPFTFQQLPEWDVFPRPDGLASKHNPAFLNLLCIIRLSYCWLEGCWVGALVVRIGSGSLPAASSCTSPTNKVFRLIVAQGGEISTPNSTAGRKRFAKKVDHKVKGIPQVSIQVHYIHLCDFIIVCVYMVCRFWAYGIWYLHGTTEKPGYSYPCIGIQGMQGSFQIT